MSAKIQNGDNKVDTLFVGDTVGFTKKVDCEWTNGKSFSVALLLSVFLGMLGVDR